MPVRQNVLLVEDNKHTLLQLEQNIVSNSCFQVFSASSLKEARQHLNDNKPDFLVLDIGLPDGSGLELIPVALQINPEILILVLTVFGENETVIQALQKGAKGYLLKDRALEEIGDVLMNMSDGHTPVDSRVTPSLLELINSYAEVRPEHSIDLSDSEKKVLALIVQGKLYKEISCQMNVSINTVREYIRRIYRKLGVHSRSQAAHRAHALKIHLD